jgi:hypothetical protein
MMIHRINIFFVLILGMSICLQQIFRKKLCHNLRKYQKAGGLRLKKKELVEQNNQSKTLMSLTAPQNY